MHRDARRGPGLVALALLAVIAAGCASSRSTRPYQEPPPPGLRPTRIDYVDSDGFDQLLESALVNQDPVIVIQTNTTRPDWGSRLNAWIAAWNRGGKVDAAGGPKVRGQAPGIPQVTVDGDSIREFRLLIESLMNRIDDHVQVGVSWWEEVRVRNRRVALLRPYNLRFHLGEDGNIQIILFNGRYAQYHRDFVRSITSPDLEDGDEWQRTYRCSECKEHRRQREAHLPSDGTAGR
jgi:hypothetical protein